MAASPAVNVAEPAAGRGAASRDEAALGRAAAMARRIDELLAARWAEAGVEPAAPVDDAEFLRRASLDLIGVIPRAADVREFAADADPEKRVQLVERLLASPRYATHMASTWRNRILPNGPEQANVRDAMALQKWLRTRFARNLRYDNLVGGLLLPTADDDFGPGLYFQANGVAPDKLAASSAELFLGLKLQCAQCHDHPFADWSQEDFWGLAAFFARTRPPDDGMGRGMSSAYRVSEADDGEVMLPETDQVVPPRFPKEGAASDDQWQSRRQQLVVWMTSRDNRFFARAGVNWAWAHMFGQGLVEGLDDVDADRPHASQPLLDELADYFVASNFDLRALWRALARSRAYQLSSRRADGAASPAELFAQMLPKPLTPEQLYDSLALLSPPPRSGPQALLRPNDMARSLDEDPRRADFVRRMRTPPGPAADYRAGTLQALMLMNGDFTDLITGPTSSRLLGALRVPDSDDGEQIDALYMAVLARAPADEERTACLEALASTADATDRDRVRSDILWALVQSTEFAFNH